MRIMGKVLFSLAVIGMVGLIGSMPVSAETIVKEEASDNGMTVVAELKDQELRLTISGIAVGEKDQVLAFSLVSEDTEEGVLYANARYVNGETTVTENISFFGEELTQEKLEGCVLTASLTEPLTGSNTAREQQVSISFAPEGTPTPASEGIPTPVPEGSSVSISEEISESTPTPTEGSGSTPATENSAAPQ